LELDADRSTHDEEDVVGRVLIVHDSLVAGRPAPGALGIELLDLGEIDLICSTSSMRKLAGQRWKRNNGSWSEHRYRGSDFPAMIWLNIRQIEAPRGSALDAKANDPTCEHVHHRTRAKERYSVY
jgi:hypothetical protein